MVPTMPPMPILDSATPLPFVPAARAGVRLPAQQGSGTGTGRPVAAVRLPRSIISDARQALRDAGFGVLDILTAEVGPTPSVLVLGLPDDHDAADRLLAAGRTGPGRVLLVGDRARLAGAALRPGQDEIVDLPCHPLQVAAAALRVSGAAAGELSSWAESVFAALPAR